MRDIRNNRKHKIQITKLRLNTSEDKTLMPFLMQEAKWLQEKGINCAIYYCRVLNKKGAYIHGNVLFRDESKSDTFFSTSVKVITYNEYSMNFTPIERLKIVQEFKKGN